MLLSSIQIQGFKSFADKTVLKFGKGITAVVGPNGSGKSNISDAVRWVLGEQSTKSLRGQSMEDVIFGGTDTRRPHGFCEVTLNIDNSDRTLNFDNDSVSVTRKYYRSHESEYLINNVSVRLKDVHELFMDTGLGRDGYSMIGQGKIDNIISSKSDERRDIFEEASGISKYRYRKTEAERKLAAAEDNLLRLHDIMDELESRVGPLKEQSEKAEKFLTLAESKKQLEIGLWLYTLDNSKDALRAQESKIDAAQIKYNEIENALSDFDAENEKNTALFAEITSEIEQKRSKIAELNEKTAQIRGDISVLNNDISHNEETIKRLTEEKEQLALNDSAAADEISKKRELAAKKAEFIETLNLKLKALEDELSALLADSESISRKIEDKIRALNDITARDADAAVSFTTANNAISEIAARKEQLLTALAEENAEKERLSSETLETQQYFDTLNDRIESAENSLKGYEMRLKNRTDAVAAAAEALQELKLDIEAKKRRIQILTELENSMEGFSKAVVSVMNESEKGLLRGIHGTVAKLITVDKKYTVAVETALGNNIQNIIVDSEADAKRAINYLKSNNSGRATFMPVSSVKAREFKEKGFEDVYGFVGIAADLVKTDAKYDEIIRYLLGGAVITEDIDSAVTLAKKYGYRVKVVSLDGQVVNPGGSLTGGSLVKQAGILSRGVDIKNLKNKVNELNAKCGAAEKDLAEKREAADSVSADISALQAEHKTAAEDRIRTVAELKRLEELTNAKTARISEITAELKDGEEKTERFRLQSESAAKARAQLLGDKNDIQSAIDEMTGGREGMTEKRDAIGAEITELKLQTIDNEKDRQALVIAADELEISIGDRADKTAELDREIAVVKFKNEQVNGDIAALNDDIENNSITAGELARQIEELQQKRNETEKAGVLLRTSERERMAEREQIGGEIARLTERRETIAREYDDVIRQLYDEYGLTRSEAEQIGIKIEKLTEAKKQLAETKGKIRALGSVNVAAIEEYKEVKERYDFMSAQIADVENSRSQLHKLINELTASMKELFVIGFDKINENFAKTFRELFGGGAASLRLTDPENVLESGIDIEARLPGKNVPSLDGLSGGEKALVALSIYFAIMQVSAPPFCFLDEVDTALDDINVDRFADYMKRTDANTQFICVTHRRGTMEAADMLYGVTMQEKGVTKLLELDVNELEKKLNLEKQGA